MAENIYAVGTVSVLNGGTTVTGVGSSWQGKIKAGDLFTDPVQGIFARVTADAASNTSLSINAWPGAALSGDVYEILLMPDSVRSSERTRELLEQLSVVQANGRGLFYRFSDTTADSDPGAGYVRLNNADPSLATAAYIDVLDANGATVSAILDSWDDEATAAARGQLWLRGVADPSAFHAYKVTGSVVDGTGYRKLTLAYIGGSGSFAADDELMVAFSAQGADGTNAILGVWQGAWVTATAYDVDDLVEQDGSTYICIEAHTSGTFSTDLAAAKWALAVEKGDTGPAGPTGDTGPTGPKGINWQGDYSGATAYVEDDGVLYNGSSWRALGATTGNAPPTLPTTSNAYWQLLARQGIDGAGTVNSVVAGTGIAVDNTDPTAPVVSAPHAVRFNEPQALTEAQQGQARANIGADVLGGFRNKLINGTWSIAQRASSGSIAAGTTEWVGDRWQVFNGTDQTLTWSIISTLNQNYAIPPHAENYLNINFAVAPTTGAVELFQRIESAKTLSKGDASLRIYASGSAAFDAYFLLQQRFGSGGSSSITVTGSTTSVNGISNFVEKKEVLTLPHTGGKTFGAGHNLTFDFVFTPRSAGTYAFTAASLVEGDATAEADPFSPRHIQQELALCQRYYEIAMVGFTRSVTSGIGYGTAVGFKVPKRAHPTFAFVNSLAATSFPATVGSFVSTTADTGILYEKVASATGGGRFVDTISIDAEL